MVQRGRQERLQIMLSEAELTAIDDWRFTRRMPSRASAIRELIKRDLSAEGFDSADLRTRSKDFGVLAESKSNQSRKAPRA